MSEENNTAIVAIENPQGNLERAEAMCAYIMRRRDEVAAQIEAADAAIDETNATSAETKAELKRLEEIVEDLRDRGKLLVREVCAKTEAQRVLTAIDARLWSYSTKADPNSAYGRLSASLKALKERVKAFADAAKPAVPVRPVPILLAATDKGVADLAAKISAGKVPGVTGYKFAPDEATEKKAVKLFGGDK